MATAPSYDALLIVGFGGPEGPDDILPFLDNVLRGKPVPAERKLEVADHYRHFGGVSPYNAQIRALIEALAHRWRSSFLLCLFPPLALLRLGPVLWHAIVHRVSAIVPSLQSRTPGTRRTRCR